MISAAYLGVIAAAHARDGAVVIPNTDPLFSLVKLLLHGEGADGSTTFTDSGPDGRSPASVNGSVAIDTAQFKYGEASIEFTSDSAINYDADASKWSAIDGPNKTFECWFRCNAGSLASRNPHLFSASTESEFGWAQFRVYIANGQLAYYSDHAGGTNSTSIAAINAEQWYHFALVTSGQQAGRNLTFFLDGVPVYIGRVTGRVGIPRLRLGSREGTTAANRLLGHMDDVRVTHEARYPQFFSVPTAQPASDANVSLLLLGNGADGSAIVDASGNAHTLTAVGTAPTVETDFTPTGVGGCLRFIGTAGYLTTPVDADFDFGTGDWTVEFWFRTPDDAAVSAARPIVSVSGSLENGHFYISRSDTANWRTPGLVSRYAGGNIAYSSYNNAALAGTTWHHVAFARHGNFLMIYVNGRLRRMETLAADQAFGISGRGWQLGYSTVTNSYADTFIADFRATKGVARYLSTFTPPIMQLPDSA